MFTLNLFHKSLFFPLNIRIIFKTVYCICLLLNVKGNSVNLNSQVGCSLMGKTILHQHIPC